MPIRIGAATQAFLADLEGTQNRLADLQRQISSGVRVGSASDDPSAIPAILDLASQISRTQQAQDNLGQAKTELQTEDSALQQSVKLIDQAITVGLQAGGTLDSSSLKPFVEQIAGIQEQIVSIANTSVSGRYAFGGDQDQQAPYELDGAQPYGVRRMVGSGSTRVVQDAQGGGVWTPITAAEIFDPTEADGSPTAGNVFAALASLRAALEANDSSAALAAVQALKSADAHVNLQLESVGFAENRVQSALDSAAQSLVGLQQQMGTLRDTDAAGAAIELTQLTMQQEASLSAASRLVPRSLFDYLA